MLTNKDGNFKGDSKYSHYCDINMVVVIGVANTTKTSFNKTCDY